MSAGWLLPLAFLCLFMAGLGAFFIDQAHDRKRRMGRRFTKALDPYTRRRGNDPDLGPKARLAVHASSLTFTARCARIFGFDQARLELYPTRPLIMIIGSFVVACLIDWLLEVVVGPLAILAVPVMLVVFSRMSFGRFHKRRALILFQQFPDALSMIVRAARVGIPIGESIKAVARENEPPTSLEFARLANQIGIGLPLDEALRAMSERTGLAEYRFFATALSLQSQTGGNLGETLDNLADVIRKRVAARARGYALAAEARMSSNMLTGLPIALFCVLEYINPSYASVLFKTHLGNMILGATLMMLGGGTLVMRIMIQKSLS
jgi:tight adherence protein B